MNRNKLWETTGIICKNLDGIPKTVRHVRGCLVTIGGVVYPAAHWDWVREWQKGERAVVDDGKVVGEEYLVPRLWCATDDPKAKPKTRKRTVWQYAGEEWYLAGWYDGGVVTEYQPVPYSFHLMPWRTYGCYAGSKIDTFERFPYERKPMTVEFLS